MRLINRVSPINAAGIVILPPIAFVKKDASDELKRHELVHVQQWLELFFLSLPFTMLAFGFYGLALSYFLFHILYMIVYTIYGYHDHPMEKDANQKIKRRALSFRWIRMI